MSNSEEMDTAAVPEDAPLVEKLLKTGMFGNMKWFPQTSPFVERHAKGLMATMIGRDFAFLAPGGVEFKIHSSMCIAGPVALEEYLHPGNVINANPPQSLQLPDEFRFHPIFMDRVVSFMYRGSYYAVTAEDRAGTKLTHATHIPPDYAPPASLTASITNFQLHLHMYHLSEVFKYPALTTHVFSRLVQSTLSPPTLTPTTILPIIRNTFSSPGSPDRICEDADRALQTLVLTAAIIHVLQKWRGDEGTKGKEHAQQWVELLKAVDAEFPGFKAQMLETSQRYYSLEDKDPEVAAKKKEEFRKKKMVARKAEEKERAMRLKMKLRSGAGAGQTQAELVRQHYATKTGAEPGAAMGQSRWHFDSTSNSNPKSSSGSPFIFASAKPQGSSAAVPQLSRRAQEKAPTSNRGIKVSSSGMQTQMQNEDGGIRIGQQTTALPYLPKTPTGYGAGGQRGFGEGFGGPRGNEEGGMDVD